MILSKQKLGNIPFFKETMKISRLKLNQLIKWNFPFNFVSGPISHISLSALSIILLTMMPEVANAGTFTFVGGNMDDFNTTDGLEQSSPSNGSVIRLINRLKNHCDNTPQRCEIRNFDEHTFDRNFLHTFNFANLAGTITSADLEIRVIGSGSSLIKNDTIGLYFVDSEGNLVPEGDPTRWGRFFGSGNNLDGLLNTMWRGGSDETFFFNLANLPLAPKQDPNLISMNLLPTLNSLGFLDIEVGDDTAVDYIKLTITTDSETIPEPTSTLSLLTLGTLGITSTLKRKLKQSKDKK